MPFLSQPRRPRRSGEWTSDKAVTFIVTLAATHSVTLAARCAGMSRKSVYALKARDRAFAAAWAAAAKAGTPASIQGDKVEEVHAPSRQDRERSFVGLMTALRQSPSLAPGVTAQ